MEKEYRLIRSRRRSLALQISPEGELIVRAPLRMSQREIDALVARHRDWIARHKEQFRQRQAAHPEPTEEERQALIRRAKEELPPKAARYAALLGVRPTRITITGARTRFGSCSGKNALSFSWRLMQYPEEAIDYVVVHELAHIRHHDHSPAFYDLIASVMPDHKERRALLRQ